MQTHVTLNEPSISIEYLKLVLVRFIFYPAEMNFMADLGSSLFTTMYVERQINMEVRLCLLAFYDLICGI